MSRVALTNLDRVLWPEVGWRKSDMVDYYRTLAGVLLPHLRGRPLTLGRFPTGVHEKGWYQTNCRGAPSWLHVAEVPASRGPQLFRMCVVNDADSLDWVVNQGTVELHPYLSAAESFDEPLALVFDLDPGEGASLADSCSVALSIAEILAADDLLAVVKTSGALGLHMYVGLAPGASFAETRAYARGVAASLVAEQPTRVTDLFTHEARAGRVLVDWRQNERGRSQVAPYSLRATPWPRVSTPVTWDEVAVAASSGAAIQFSPKHVVERVEAFGDLFAPVLLRSQRIPATATPLLGPGARRAPGRSST